MKNYILMATLLLTQLASAQVPTLPVLRNTLAMTASTALIQPQKPAAIEETLTILPGRQNVYLMEDLGKIHFTYQLQKNRRAPLVFVIPGTGGAYNSSTSLSLAEKLFAMGYHTITIDNAFNWNFVVAASTSAIPGYPVEDAKDLYRVMEKISKYLVSMHGVRPRSHSLIGYSFGALHSLFLKRLDDSIGKFKFSRLFLINPPLDLMHGVNALDALHAQGERLSPRRKTHVMGKLMDVGQKVISSGKSFSTAEDLQLVFDQLGFTKNDLAFLVANSFRGSLRDIIFASQQVKDLHILKSPVTRFNRNTRYNEAGTISFTDYMNRLVLPMAQGLKEQNYPLEDLNRDSSIYQFADLIKNDSKIFLAHSQDDFLLKEGDLQWIAQTFGPRAVIFPYGGHCGNIGFPQFSSLLQQAFQLRGTH